MTVQRDAPEQTAADQADGLLTRREAMRRLVLGGLTASPAALIAACSGRGGWPSRRRRRRR